MDVRVDEITGVRFGRGLYPFASFPGREVLTVEFLGPGGQDSVGCPKAMATVIANATARRTANAITCLVSGTGSMGIRHQVLGG